MQREREGGREREKQLKYVLKYVTMVLNKKVGSMCG
jgi:hypothetical protein